MKYDNNYLNKLLTLHGVDKALGMIDLENVEDLTIKIIIRTILQSKEILIKELENRCKNDANSSR